jgi:hypothetical protein
MTEEVDRVVFKLKEEPKKSYEKDYCEPLDELVTLRSLELNLTDPWLGDIDLYNLVDSHHIDEERKELIITLKPGEFFPQSVYNRHAHFWHIRGLESFYEDNRQLKKKRWEETLRRIEERVSEQLK